MQSYQKEFIEFAIETGVLRFGEFTLKSGRISPYFFNAGLFNTGAALAKLGRYYAAAIEAASVEYDVIFGPAYRNPLASSLSVSLYSEYNKDVPYAFNRKEAKTHGEGGNLVGAPLTGGILIVDDVITAGTAIREVMSIIDAQPDAKPAAVVIALDRQERGQGALSAIQEVERDFDVPVVSIVGLNQILDYVSDDPEFAQYAESISEYKALYGI